LCVLTETSSTLYILRQCLKLINRTSGVRRKFSWGGSFSGIWWSFVFVWEVCDVTIWRHIHVFKPTFWRSLL